jgi:pimeloyl-ACP methyl ester carboxylesterase
VTCLESPTAVDEFAALAEVADELGSSVLPLPVVHRQSVRLDADHTMSAIIWGDAEPELVLVHGGGQNAHTWDLVALALQRPIVALDLPGHGHSSWRSDHDYSPVTNASAVGAVVEVLAPRAKALVGMSLGGLTSIHLAATRPELVRSLFLVDVTPGSPEAAQSLTDEQRGATVLTRGATTFPDREAMVQAALRASPNRSPAAVRRGVIHNSRALPSGEWAWRYDPRPAAAQAAARDAPRLWHDLTELTMPLALARGGDSRFVTDADLTRLRHLVPQAEVHTVSGAGHAVQSDRPTELAQLILDFTEAPGASLPGRP